MTANQVLALGMFMMAAGAYVHDGASSSSTFYFCVAVAMGLICMIEEVVSNYFKHRQEERKRREADLIHNTTREWRNFE